MKTTPRLLRFFRYWLSVLCLLVITGCTVTTNPDGTTTTAPDPVAYQAALVALDAYARAHPVHPDK